jgi:hypothetical protein
MTINYEKGLKILEIFIRSEDDQTRKEFDLFKFNLRRILDDRKFGPNEKLDSDLNRVILELNVITRRLNIGKSFDDLCVVPNDIQQPLQLQLMELKPLLANITLINNELKNLAVAGVTSPNRRVVPPNCHEKETLICLLEWLAKMPVSSTGRMPLLDFVAQINQYASPTHKKQIEVWIKNVAEDQGIEIPLSKSNTPLSLPAYLLIELALKYKDKKYYTVQAWLFMTTENVKNIYTKDKAILNEMPILTKEILGIIDDLNVNHKQLTIEFILPRHLLCHNVEHWTDEWGDPLGIRYRVVVRSHERLRNKKLQRFWCACWNEAKQKGTLQQAVKTCAVRIDKTPLRHFHSKVDNGKFCFILTSVPKIMKNLEKDVFFALTKSGVPIALWPRQINSAHELIQQLNELLSCPLEQLPQCLFKNRYDLWKDEKEQHTGYHLSLLWDDPDRIPPDLQNDPNKVPFELQKLQAPN